MNSISRIHFKAMREEASVWVFELHARIRVRI